MKHFAFMFCLVAMSASAQQKVDYTRGIGQYPGAPSEYYAPTVSWTEGGQVLTNVALHSASWVVVC